MNQKTVFFVFLASFIFGCVAPPQYTREEYTAMRADYDDSRTRTYTDKTKAEVEAAVETLFRLADVDYQISYGDNVWVANRHWTLYMLIGAAWGKDYWYIDISEASGDGSTIVVRQFSDSQTASATPTGGGGAQVTTAGRMINPDVVDQWELQYRQAMYAVFFGRLDFLLGKKDQWLDCDTAKKWVKENNLKGPLDPLCLCATDSPPPGVFVVRDYGQNTELQ